MNDTLQQVLKRVWSCTHELGGRLENALTAFSKLCKGALTVALLLALFLVQLPALALSAPSISPTTGSFTTEQTVTMTTGSGTIYYTTDGSQPTNSSTEYTSSFTVGGPTQINAVAYDSGTYSSVTTVFLDVDASLTPVLQSGLVLRLRAGLGPITTGGSPGSVSSWADLSGNGNDATGAFGSQPTLVTNASNGLPSIKFNGSQYLSLPSGFADFTGGATLFIVTSPSSLTASARILDLGDAGSGNNLLFRIASSGSYGEFATYSGASGTSADSASALTQGQFQVLQAVLHSGSPDATGTVSVNGTAGTPNSSMNNLPNTSRTSNFIGQASSGGNLYQGSIAEILLFNTELTQSEYAAISAWLMQKYQVLSQVPETPAMSVAGGTLSGPTQVTIFTPPGSATYVTTDGTTPDPTNSSQAYCGCPLTINYTQTVKALSVKDGVQSSVASQTYTLDSTLWPAPSSGDMTAPTINLILPVATH